MGVDGCCGVVGVCIGVRSVGDCIGVGIGIGEGVGVCIGVACWKYG